MQAIILAGGLGTRLRSVVSDRPKPMALVEGKPFLEYVLQGLKKAELMILFLPSVIRAAWWKNILETDRGLASGRGMRMRKSCSARRARSRMPGNM